MSSPRKPRLLDLFSGAGGAAMGYARAGFEVVGVDLRPMPRYPFEHHVADALTFPLDGFDAVHASPPCQAYSSMSARHPDRRHPELVEPVRGRLLASGLPYVIENVPGAPLVSPALYCGAAFGLYAVCADGVRRQLRRHRLFESSVWLMTPGCACDGRQKIGVYGTGSSPLDNRRAYQGHAEERRAALGVPWMTKAELAQAIPPSYTEHIGAQLIEYLKREAA